MKVSIDIDGSQGDDLIVYTIPHKIAFKMLEQQVCDQFHGVGNFSTHTRAQISNGAITFVVQVKKNATQEADHD